jgi:predicted nucleic acid-binding protein
LNYVYDVSYLFAIILPDERNPKIDGIHDALNENDAIHIPQLVWYEAANIFRNLLLRKRFSVEDITHFIPMLSFVNLETDFETGLTYIKKIWNLGDKYNLSAYDAAYLELADRKNAILCTLDSDLLNAARKHGVKTIS